MAAAWHHPAFLHCHSVWSSSVPLSLEPGRHANAAHHTTVSSFIHSAAQVPEIANNERKGIATQHPHHDNTQPDLRGTHYRNAMDLRTGCARAVSDCVLRLRCRWHLRRSCSSRKRFVLPLLWTMPHAGRKMQEMDLIRCDRVDDVAAVDRAKQG
eukprot:3274318-Rhodomonas_salina.1